MRAPALLAAALAPCFAARPASPAAPAALLAALPAARFAVPRPPIASRPCRVPAAFLPAVADRLRGWLRFLVAAAFFAAADLVAVVEAVVDVVAAAQHGDRGAVAAIEGGAAVPPEE